MDEIVRTVEKVFMFDNGAIVEQGSPAKVFSNITRLNELGLAAPKMTMVAARLRFLGLPIPDDILTIEQLHKALNEIRVTSLALEEVLS
jgi:energy-coupling factor transport system ATP-binding protein